jgi:hypothetical protein
MIIIYTIQYKYFNHLRYGKIRDITYQVQVFDKEKKLVYFEFKFNNFCFKKSFNKSFCAYN